MPTDSLEDTLVRVRSLIIDLERHVDRAAAESDLAQVGRAWVRAAQVEKLLRSALPADVAANVPDVGEPDPSACRVCDMDPHDTTTSASG